MAHLHAQDLGISDFLKMCEKLSGSDDYLMMAFSPSCACFDLYRYNEQFLKTTDQGRIFSPNGEYKWRRIDKVVRVVYLGNLKPLAELQDHSKSLIALTPIQQTLMLWGVRTNLENEWVESKVTPLFSYPIATKAFSRGRAVLSVENWIDSSGFPQFARYHSIKEITGGTHAPR